MVESISFFFQKTQIQVLHLHGAQQLSVTPIPVDLITPGLLGH